MSFALTDPVVKRSATVVLEGSWARSVLQKALISTTPEPNILAVRTIAGRRFDSTERLTEMSAQLLPSKAGVLIEELRTGSNNDWWKHLVGDMGNREEKNGKSVGE